MRSFLGITAHYISPDWELRSAMLACKPFSGRHTAENISAQFEETLTVFDISTKVSHVVSDSASNMRSAISLPGYVQETVEDLVGDDISDNEDSEIETDIVENIFAFLPEHDPCFAHTLQLVVKDGLKEAGALTKVIAKASKVVTYVRKSTIATDLLEGEGRLQAANATRWNSEVKMIRSVLDCTKLTAYDRNLLQDLITILTPFEEATDIAQRQNIVSSSFVVPCVLRLKAELENMQSRYNCKLVAALKKSVDRRLTPFKDRAVFCMASTLDPRFKLQWCMTEEEIARQRTALGNKVREIQPQEAPQPEADTPTSPPRKKARLQLFRFIEAPVPSNVPSNVDQEVADYLASPVVPDDSDPLLYWKMHSKSFPCLSTLAMKYLAVPSSSAPVERIFSVGGKIFRPDRCRLSDATFEHLMFIKLNKHFDI